MSSFLVRRVSQHTLPSSNPHQKTQQKLIISPTKIIFNAQQQFLKKNVVKFILTNHYNYKIQFQIKQPREQCFHVKCPKSQLSTGQSIQFYLFNNCDNYYGNINDQFIIATHFTNIFVPIEVINTEQSKKNRRSLRKDTKVKENNMQNTKLKINNMPNNNNIPVRNYRDIRRKDAVMILNRDRKQGDRSIIMKIKEEDNSLQGRIKKFDKEYERIQIFLKDKAIKSEIYLGQKPVTMQKHYEIISFNLSTELITKQLMKQQILKRYQSKNTRNGPSVRVFENIRLQWNKLRNEPRITYKKGLEKLFRQVRNIVIYHRFRKMNKILSIYRNLRGESNIEQPQTKIIYNQMQHDIENEENDEESFIWTEERDNKQDIEYQIELQEKKKHDYYCRKITKMIMNKKQKNLGADFTQFTLAPKLLPVDYTDPQSRKTHTFEIKPRIGFDNWVSLEQSTVYNHELMGYTKMQRLPQWQCHPYYEDKIKCKTKSSQKEPTVRYQRQRNSFKGQNQQVVLKNFIPKIVKNQKLAQPKTKSSIDYQFAQSTKQTSFTSYKNYTQSEYQINFLSLEQQKTLQLDVNKPITPSISSICEIKHNRQQYLPYCENPLPSLTSAYTSKSQYDSSEELIYSLKKEDIIDFDDPSSLIMNKIQYIEETDQMNRTICKNINTIGSYKSNNSFNQCILSEPDLFYRNEVRYKNWDKDQGIHKQFSKNTNSPNSNMEEKDEIVYEKILQNLKLSQIRKYGIANGKIASYNGFVKRTQNKIYY